MTKRLICIFCIFGAVLLTYSSALAPFKNALKSNVAITINLAGAVTNAGFSSATILGLVPSVITAEGETNPEIVFHTLTVAQGVNKTVILPAGVGDAGRAHHHPGERASRR